MALKFKGILNGIEALDWDPSRDPLLPANYNAECAQGKALCKEFLQKVSAGVCERALALFWWL